MFYFVSFYVLRSHHFLRRLRNRRPNKEKCSEINWHKLLFFIKSCWYLGMTRLFYMWIYNFKSLAVLRVLVLQNLICSRIGLIMQNVFFFTMLFGRIERNKKMIEAHWLVSMWSISASLARQRQFQEKGTYQVWKVITWNYVCEYCPQWTSVSRRFASQRPMSRKSNFTVV